MKKKLFSFVVLLAVIMTFAVPSFAEASYVGRVFDNAGFINYEDLEALQGKLYDYYEEYGTEFLVWTDTADFEVSEESVEDLADSIYDEMFDGEPGNECVILVVIDDTLEKDYAYIYTSGEKTRKAISDDAVPYLLGELKSGGKSDRFILFADACGTLLADYAATGKEYKAPFEWGKAILISLVIGFVIAIIVVLVMKGKLKSVRMKDNATDYTVPGSMNITDGHELYLYSTVVATPKPRNDSSSSSGGSSHGGGGGRV